MTAERAALIILLRVTRDGAYLNLAVKEELSSVSEDDRARVSALVYTTVEHLGYCDFLIEKYARGRLHSSVRAVLRLATAEMFFMDAPDYAVCSRAVSLVAEAGKPQLKGYVNAVLRSIARDKAAGSLPALPSDFISRMEILSGYPSFVISEYKDRFGEEFAESMLTARPEGVTLRAVRPTTADELISAFEARGISARKSGLVTFAVKTDGMSGSVADDPLFKAGKYTVQSESAMLAVVCLDPQPGDCVLDACAAPGGKTALIAELMENRGSVTAWDIHPHRVELIKNTLERLGVTCAVCKTHDASLPDPSLADSFDKILLDVPCSGLLGSSKPDARYRRTDEGIEELSHVQRAILEASCGMLKPGGVMVYSTCTVSLRENEAVVDAFLQEHPEFSPVPLSAYLPESFGERGRNGYLQLFPNTDDTEGFFIAKLVRRA